MYIGFHCICTPWTPHTHSTGAKEFSKKRRQLRKNVVLFIYAKSVVYPCTNNWPKSNPNFRDTTRNVVKNEILHEIFRIVSRFPATFRVISRKIDCIRSGVWSGWESRPGWPIHTTWTSPSGNNDHISHGIAVTCYLAEVDDQHYVNHVYITCYVYPQNNR